MSAPQAFHRRPTPPVMAVQWDGTDEALEAIRALLAPFEELTVESGLVDGSLVIWHDKNDRFAGVDLNDWVWVETAPLERWHVTHDSLFRSQFAAEPAVDPLVDALAADLVRLLAAAKRVTFATGPHRTAREHDDALLALRHLVDSLTPPAELIAKAKAVIAQRVAVAKADDAATGGEWAGSGVEGGAS